MTTIDIRERIRLRIERQLAGVSSPPPLKPGPTATHPSPANWSPPTRSPVPNFKALRSLSAKDESSETPMAPTATRRRTKPLESDEQKTVIAWAALAQGTWPDLRLLHAVPNGYYGGKDRIAAAKHFNRLRAEGLRPGWPDLNLPVARGPFIGLAIEMKRSGQTPTPEQVDFLGLLTKAGHRTRVCFSASEAIETLREYLMLPPRNAPIVRMPA
jgi:hypothetical protein